MKLISFCLIGLFYSSSLLAASQTKLSCALVKASSDYKSIVTLAEGEYTIENQTTDYLKESAQVATSSVEGFSCSAKFMREQYPESLQEVKSANSLFLTFETPVGPINSQQYSINDTLTMGMVAFQGYECHCLER